MRDLLFRPGRLTAAYFQGHRVRYLSAIQTYLIAAALFFFANSASPFISVDRETGAVQSALGIMGVGADERDAPPHGLTPAEFEERLRATANNQLPAFLIGVVALFALLVALTYPKRERNLLKHVVFALHWTSFYMAILILERISGREPGDPDAMSVVVAVLGLAWLTVALRRTYGQGWPVSIAKGVWLYLAFNMLLAVWVGGVLAWALRSI